MVHGSTIFPTVIVLDESLAIEHNSSYNIVGVQMDRETEILSIIKTLDQRLLKIESQLGINKDLQQPPPLKAASANSNASAKTSANHKTPIASSEPQGGRFLGGVGIFFFILAASYLIRLAVDSGWLTPERQLGGAIIFGMLLIVSSLHLNRRDAPYSGLLAAAGVIILFMSAYAGHVYSNFYNSFTAAIAAGAVSLFSIYIFTIFRHDFFLIASICGTYFVPILINTPAPDIHNHAIYFLFWDVLYCICAILLHRRLLIGLTAYLAIGIFYGAFISHLGAGDTIELSNALIIQTTQFMIMAISVGAFSSITKKPLTSFEAWMFLPVLLFFYFVEYEILNRLLPSYTPWFGLGFAAIIYAIYLSAKKLLGGGSLQSSPMIATFISIVIIHTVYLDIMPDHLSPWFGLLSLLILTGLSKFGFTYKHFWPAYLIFFAVIGIEYLRVLGTSGGDRMIEFLFLNIIFAGLFFGKYFGDLKIHTPSFFLLSIASIQALNALSRIATEFAPISIVQYVTSALWASFALVLLIVGHKFRDALLAKSTLFVFAIVAVKVLFYDINSADSIARIVALVVVGTLLYTGGLLVRQINTWQKV